VSANRSAIRGMIALDIQFQDMITALFGSNVISWEVVKSGVEQIATSKIFIAKEMSERKAIVMHVTTVTMENTCGEMHVMQRNLGKMNTKRVCVVKNTHASRMGEILVSAHIMITALPNDHLKYQSAQKRATPIVKAGTSSWKAKRMIILKKKSATCTRPKDVEHVKMFKTIVDGKK